MKREIEAPAKQLLTRKEALAWLESQGVDASEDLFKEWLRRGYLFGVRKYNRQQVFYHWQGLVALLWRIELDDADPEKQRPKVGETGAEPP